MTVAQPPSLAVDSRTFENSNDTREEWVEIEDPQSGNIFFANPITGECLWEEPPNVIIRPRDPSGEWWELFDETHGIPYYYNTYTGQTDWIRPESGTVLPLHALQSSSMGKRMSVAIVDRASRVLSAEDTDFTKLEEMYGRRSSPHQDPSAESDPNQRVSIYTVETPRSSIYSEGKMSEASFYSTMHTSPGPYQQHYPDHQRNQSSSSSTGGGINSGPRYHEGQTQPPIPQISCSIIDEEPVQQRRSRKSPSPSPSQRQRQQQAQSSQLTPNRSAPRTRSPNRAQMTVPDQQRQIPRSASAINLSASGHENEADNAGSLFIQPIHKTASVMEFSREGAMDSPTSAGPAGDSGPAATSNSNQSSSQRRNSLQYGSRTEEFVTLQIDGIAKKHFATHTKGIFRRKVPVEKMLEWTKESIKLPLLTLNRDVHRDALKIFKIIQRIMGDRPRARGSSALDDIQWLLERGLQQGELRDEIYVQTCKQVSHNPSRTSVFKGWELMCVICVTFPPSKNFEDYLKTFISQHYGEKDQVSVLAKHCHKKMVRICNIGPKGKAPTFGEIEHAKTAAFNPSVFGESLETIMELQAEKFPNLEVPRILTFLAESILDLGGQNTEGIFRVPGDADYVTNLRLRVEKGNYDMAGIRDPNVPASLLKFWLRDLEDPLIPAEFYRECIANSEDEEAALSILQRLPKVNRLIVGYMINFLQAFATPECTQRTKMTEDNLAMVFAPNFLRCPTSSLTQIFENTRREQTFVRTLIVNLECEPVS